MSQSVGEPTDSDGDSVKSHSKLNSDGRRRSLLPWSIKNRSKHKKRTKEGISDVEDDIKRQSYSLCRISLPDNSTAVVPCKPGETVSLVVQRLLEKRELKYSAFDIISVSNGKTVDVNADVSDVSTREIRVEPRTFIEIELPFGWKVGLRANPSRRMAEVLKPILAQHSLKLDNVILSDIETGEEISLKCPVGKIDGHTVSVDTKGDTNLGEELRLADTPHSVEDDQISSKTNSSHGSSSVFKGFLRRNSRKHGREKSKMNPEINSTAPARKQEVKSKLPIPTQEFNKCKTASHSMFKLPPSVTHGHVRSEKATIVAELQVPISVPNANCATSPLSLIPSELILTQNSRNRKPIYMNQPPQSS